MVDNGSVVPPNKKHLVLMRPKSQSYFGANFSYRYKSTKDFLQDKTQHFFKGEKGFTKPVHMGFGLGSSSCLSKLGPSDLRNKDPKTNNKNKNSPYLRIFRLACLETWYNTILFLFFFLTR